MKNTEKKGYRSAFKATSLFGGIQVFTILIKVIKSKLVAVWLGPTGFGIMSLFNAVISLISSISNLGLQNSAVRDIASAQGQNDTTLVSKIIKSINRWVWATGLFGAIITIILSPWLSKLLFESDKYTISFILLSSVVLLTAIFNGHYAVLQGTRQLRLMAKANIFGALAGFISSVPMFYFFREQGIAWALILTALSTTIISSLFAKKVKLISISQDYKESFILGLSTVKLGIMMSLGSIAALCVQFTVKTFITREGGIDDVGLYQAGWALNAQYLGMVFAAMAKDYFPRISQYSNDNIRINKSVNEQAEIAILILGPVIIVMLVFNIPVIKLIYSVDFVEISLMVKWLMIGSFIKAGSWAVSFVFLAKGDGKTFLFNELGINVISLLSSLLAYYYFGLAGIGYSFTFIYCVYFIWVVIVANKKYQINYNRTFWKLFITLLTIILIFPIGEILWDFKYIIGSILIIITSSYSIYELNTRLNFKKMFNKKQK
tara:strand:- start:13645 stop:15117 length:1473 start_codon:yes stop_codon:yes gene_type:complete